MQRRPPSFTVQSISFFILGLLFLSCSGIDDLSRENYRKGIFYQNSLADEPLSVLPMIGSGEQRVYLQPAESIFFEALTEMRQTAHLISPEENLARIKEENLYPAFQRFQKEATFKQVAEERGFKEFKKALGTRFVLQTELQQVETTDGATQVRIQGRIWDTDVGDIVWEGTGESRGYLFLFFPRVPASFEKAAEVASRGLIRKLP